MSFRTGRKPGEEPAWILRCHSEKAESHAKRATPNEEPALSLPKGPMQLALSAIDVDCDVDLDSDREGLGLSRATNHRK